MSFVRCYSPFIGIFKFVKESVDFLQSMYSFLTEHVKYFRYFSLATINVPLRYPKIEGGLYDNT